MINDLEENINDIRAWCQEGKLIVDRCYRCTAQCFGNSIQNATFKNMNKKELNLQQKRDQQD